MQVGEHVVCVNDHFPTPLAKCYLNLPVKGKTYTIRAVFVGRGVMHPGPGAEEGLIGLLLDELTNGMDPRHKYKQELGLNSERFRPLQERDASKETEEELVMVGISPKAEPFERNGITVFPQSPTRGILDECRLPEDCSSWPDKESEIVCDAPKAPGPGSQ